MTSGLWRDQQDSVLAVKQGIAHDIFLEFKVEELPIAQPPTLINAGNAMGHAAALQVATAADCTDNPDKSVLHCTKPSQYSQPLTLDTVLTLRSLDMEPMLMLCKC